MESITSMLRVDIAVCIVINNKISKNKTQKKTQKIIITGNICPITIMYYKKEQYQQKTKQKKHRTLILQATYVILTYIMNNC